MARSGAFRWNAVPVSSWLPISWITLMLLLLVRGHVCAWLPRERRQESQKLFFKCTSAPSLCLPPSPTFILRCHSVPFSAQPWQ